MKPWERITSARTPDGSLLELLRHDQDFIIRVDGWELMTSRMHDSEEAMMRLACAQPPAEACVLVGGLGMGYTTAAALAMLSARASVVVAELVPEVVAWNRGVLGPLANHPLDDPRTEILVGDVTRVIRRFPGRFDAILLDVDNGPDTLTDAANAALYSPDGLHAAYRALRRGGALAVWSVGNEPDAALPEYEGFEARLRDAGFEAASHAVAAGNRGRTHVVLVGRRA